MAERAVQGEWDRNNNQNQSKTYFVASPTHTQGRQRPSTEICTTGMQKRGPTYWTVEKLKRGEGETGLSGGSGILDTKPAACLR